MSFVRLLRPALLLAFLLLAALPASALAGGPPLPPLGPFWAPATPTPAPLPTATPTSEPQPAAPATPLPPAAAPLLTSQTPASEPPEPGASPARVFLPRVHRAVRGALTVAPTVTPAPAEDPRSGSFIYQIKAGDTPADLALDFGRDVGVMSCALSPDGFPLADLGEGDELVVPALGDLCHKVKSGETLARIAAWYGVSELSLRAAPQNALTAGKEPRVGQYLLIPNARTRYRDPAEVNLPRPQVEGWAFGDGEFIWPVDIKQAWLSQGFKHGKHAAIDLAMKAGSSVRAADTGVVTKADWTENGYGYRIVIDHGIDYITLYAHLSEYYVKTGDIVQKGQIIGAVGSTGNSTGPHLHFEVRDFGFLINPLLVLPPATEPQTDVD